MKQSVIGLEAGLCSQVKADPVTGEKLVYCCLDEGFIYQKEGTQQEFETFVSLLKQLEGMSAKEARPVFEAPYGGSIHLKYGWTNLCGKQIPCEVCSQDHICGNSVVESNEKCDDGPRNSDETPDTCRLDCSLPACGDSVIDVKRKEECDDGKFNNEQPNHCRSDCKLPFCGDLIIDSLRGEACDAGEDNSSTLPNHCRADCQSPHCGDRVIDANEECDDGNRADGDGCSYYCQSENQQVAPLPARYCGNGTKEPGEECDDGIANANIPNHCRQNCARPRCGDRIQDAGEECDDGNRAENDGCSSSCTRELVLSLTNICGNQMIDAGEECDAGRGNENTPDHCRFDCRFPACGDGIKDTNEQCDDANREMGDGCTKDCFSEFCGDGKREMGEECDDGNLISGDGCSRLCQKDVLRSAAGSGATAGRPLAGKSSSAAQSSSPMPEVTENPTTDQSQDSAGISADSPSQALVIPFPDAPQFTGATQTAPSAFERSGQPVATPASSSLNDTGPAALSIVAMGSAAGLAWVRRKRRK